MTRIAMMAVAVLCYLAFFAAFVYFVGFAGNLPGWPLTVDRGPQSPLGTALLIDLALVALFGLQHSIMARPAFKVAWTRIVPAPIERSIYCLASALALGVMFYFWQPITSIVWDVTNPAGRIALWSLFGLGWVLVFISTHLISHWELFGLAQPWRHMRGIEAPPPNFRTPGFYRAVRHPIYLGFLLAVWAIPTMTVGHLVLAAGLSVYILIGVRYEERDLITHFGAQYADYRTRVGMLIPGLGKRA